MIRFSNKPGQFTLLDVGTYDLQIEGVELREKNNNEQLVVKSRVVGGRNDGKQVTDWFTLTEAAGWRIAQLVEATGVPAVSHGEDRDGTPIYQFDENDLVGLYFRADVTHREYVKDGQTKKAMNFANFTSSDFGAATEEEEEGEPEPAPAPQPVRRQPQAAGGGVARRPRGATA